MCLKKRNNEKLDFYSLKSEVLQTPLFVKLTETVEVSAGLAELEAFVVVAILKRGNNSSMG